MCIHVHHAIEHPITSLGQVISLEDVILSAVLYCILSIRNLCIYIRPVLTYVFMTDDMGALNV